MIPRCGFVMSALVASLAAAAAAGAETIDGRPMFEVLVIDRSAAAASELQAARMRARSIFADAGIRLVLVAETDVPAAARAMPDRVTLIVLGEHEAGRLLGRNGHRLGFAIPPANRVYVNYDGVHRLARLKGVHPGWFLGLVIAHELGHLRLPAGHSKAGVMAPSLAPDSRVPATFTPREARILREKLRGETTIAREERRY